MLKKMSIFSKIILLIVLLLTSVLLLYGRSNYVSVKVIERTLKDANYEQLSFFVHQMDTTIRQLSTFTVTLNDDPDIMKFHRKFIESSYMNIDVIFQKERIMQKLLIQSLSAAWGNELSVFSPSIQEVLSTNSNKRYDEDQLKRKINRGWQVHGQSIAEGAGFEFSYSTVEPFTSIDRFDQLKRVIEVRFGEQELRKALDEYKASGSRNPFFYHPDHGIIHNSTARLEHTEQVVRQLGRDGLRTDGSLEVDLEHSPYFVTYIQSEQLGWYVVDYVAVDDILAPINESRNYFYGSIAILIIVSLFATYMLYKHVQRPVRELTRGVRTIERGDYSARMPEQSSADFKFLFNSFNRMAERIENLIQTVLTERIRIREAELKQLQTQINPHFLFNCFAFIMSMAKSGKTDLILSITHSLSKYYRYTTRSEVMLCKLEEELSFVQHYLSIHQLRMPRLKYYIKVEEAVLEIVIPKLLIQPLVENAIIHGIEAKLSASRVNIIGTATKEGCRIIVEDDGQGMSGEEMDRLMDKINGPLLEEMGCGMWNVNQRVKMMFGEGAGLSYERTADGRTRAILHINAVVRRQDHV
jgi:two-component system sensor histidine kinase YesM